MKIQIRKEGDWFCAYVLNGRWLDGSERWDYVPGSSERSREKCRYSAIEKIVEESEVVEEFEL